MGVTNGSHFIMNRRHVFMTPNYLFYRYYLYTDSKTLGMEVSALAHNKLIVKGLIVRVYPLLAYCLFQKHCRCLVERFGGRSYI